MVSLPLNPTTPLWTGGALGATRRVSRPATLVRKGEQMENQNEYENHKPLPMAGLALLMWGGCVWSTWHGTRFLTLGAHVTATGAIGILLLLLIMMFVQPEGDNRIRTYLSAYA